MDELMDISSRALVVSTNIRVWTGEKRDRKITREICTIKGASDNAVRANKSLLGDAIKPVQVAERRIRGEVNERTLPWLDDGARLLKGSTFRSFTEALTGPIRDFDRAVEEFIDAYPSVKRDAARRLGDAYSEADFPLQEKLKPRFGATIVFLPVPEPQSDFRVHLASDEIAAVRQSAETALRDSMKEALRSLLERLQEPVEHMVSRLRMFRRRSNGKVEHPFRDSLILNVREMLALAPALNLTDDATITALCQEMERKLTGYSPERLRNSSHLREQVADDAEEILRKMQGVLA